MEHVSDSQTYHIFFVVDHHGKHDEKKRSRVLDKLRNENPPFYKVLYYSQEDLEFVLLCFDIYRSKEVEHRMVANSIRSQICKVLKRKVDNHVEWEPDVEEPCWLSCG